MIDLIRVFIILLIAGLFGYAVAQVVDAPMSYLISGIGGFIIGMIGFNL